MHYVLRHSKKKKCKFVDLFIYLRALNNNIESINLHKQEKAFACTIYGESEIWT